MYISNFWIVISVIWIIYLLWEIHQLKDGIQKMSEFTDPGIEKKQRQIYELCGLIRDINAKTLSKASAKKQDEVLNFESNEIIAIFERNHADGIVMQGQYMEFEPDALTRLGQIYDVYLSKESSRADNVKELSDFLKIDLK